MSGIDFDPLFVSLFRIRIVCGAANAQGRQLSAEESADIKKHYAAELPRKVCKPIRNFHRN